MTTLIPALFFAAAALVTPGGPPKVSVATPDAGVSDNGGAPPSPALAPDAGAYTTGDAAAPGIDGGTPGETGPPGPVVVGGEPETAAPPPDGSVKGRVFAKGSRQPLAGASIIIDGVNRADTDGHGRFEVNLARGRHHIQVQVPGFEPAHVVVEAGHDPPSIVIRLVPQLGRDRYQTVVRSRRTEGSAISFEKEELTRIPGTLGDPFRALETLPGVAPIAWPLPIYAVRGANPGNTGFFLDGLRVPALFHFALGPGVIHPGFIEGMDFYPGGYPARHGRYVAGVVTASTRPPPADLAHAAADVRLFDAGVLASSPFDGGRGTIEIAGRYSYTAAIFSVLNSDVNLSYADAQLRADHTLGPGRLTLLAFGSTDTLTSKDPMNTNDRVSMSFARADLRYTVGIGPGQITLAMAAGADRSRAPFQSNTLGVTDRSLMPRASFRLPIGQSVDVEVGSDAEFQIYTTTLRTPNPAFSELARDRSASMVGAYGMTSLRLGSRLILTPAFRGDVYAQDGLTRFAPGPRMTARVRVGDEVWLKAIGGRYSQMPSFPLQIAGFEGFGLAQHGLQTSWQGSVGVESPLGGGFTLDGSAYVQRYVLTDIRDPDSGDYLLNDFLVRRDALSYGLELLVRRPITARLSGWLGYTLSRNLRAFEGGAIGPSDWDERHILNLVVGYRIGRYTIGGRTHLHTGRPIRVTDTFPVAYARPPVFYQVDLRAERRFLFDRFALDLYIELINATFTRQVTSLLRLSDGTIEQHGFQIVVPSIGVRAEI